MERGRKISVHLYERHIRILDRLAKRCGTRSAALQHLLDEHRLEAAYAEYYAQPGVKEAERALTEEMLAISSWFK